MAINLAQLVGMMGGGGMGRRFGRGGMGMMRPGGGGMREQAVPMTGGGDPTQPLGGLAGGAPNSPGGFTGGMDLGGNMAKPAMMDNAPPPDAMMGSLGNAQPNSPGGFAGGLDLNGVPPGYMGGSQGQGGNGAWGPFGGRPTPGMGMKGDAPPAGGSEMEQIVQMLLRGRR